MKQIDMDGNKKQISMNSSNIQISLSIIDCACLKKVFACISSPTSQIVSHLVGSFQPWRGRHSKKKKKCKGLPSFSNANVVIIHNNEALFK